MRITCADHISVPRPSQVTRLVSAPGFAHSACWAAARGSREQMQTRCRSVRGAATPHPRDKALASSLTLVILVEPSPRV